MVFCVVFHTDSFDRITANDPGVVEGDVLMKLRIDRQRLLPGLRFDQVDLLVCYEPDERVFADKCKELGGDGEKIVQWLGRGWKNLPGDTDPVVFSSLREGK